MESALHIGSWVLLMGGAFFCFIGGLGLLRLPDFYSRMHAAGITDTLGATLMILGLALQSSDPMVHIKLGLVLVFLLMTSPTATHAVARSAYARGIEPWTKGGAEEAPE